MKRYLYVTTITSSQGCRTVIGCIDRRKLEEYLSQQQFAAFKIDPIKKSGRYYNTDGNKEIWRKR